MFCSKKFKLLPVQVAICATVLISTSSFAGIGSALELYGGVSGGADYFTPKREVTQITAGLPSIKYKNTDNKIGAVGNVFLGIVYQAEQGGLALELADQVTGAETEAKIENYLNNQGIIASANIKHLNTASISLVPNIRMTQTTNLFLRGGFAKGQFRVESGDDTGGNLIATGSRQVWRNGYIAGIGMETCVSPSISVRLEYDYAQFQSISASSTLPIIYLGDTINSKVTPRDSVAMLSIVFHALPQLFS